MRALCYLSSLAPVSTTDGETPDILAEKKDKERKKRFHAWESSSRSLQSSLWEEEGEKGNIEDELKKGGEKRLAWGCPSRSDFCWLEDAFGSLEELLLLYEGEGEKSKEPRRGRKKREKKKSRFGDQNGWDVLLLKRKLGHSNCHVDYHKKRLYAIAAPDNSPIYRRMFSYEWTATAVHLYGPHWDPPLIGATPLTILLSHDLS